MDLALPVHLSTAQLVALTVGLAVGIALGAITGVLMVVENRDRALARRFDLCERLLPTSPRTAEVSAVAWDWYRALQEETARADRAERDIAGLRGALEDSAHDGARLRDEIARVTGDGRAARARADGLLRALLGPRYAHIAAHAPGLLTDDGGEGGDGWQTSARHAGVAPHEFGFVADEFPALLDRLAADPDRRYALLWAGLWAPSEAAWDMDDHTWIADLLDTRTGEVVECNDAAAVVAGWPDLAGLRRRPSAPDGPPPPGDMTLAEVRAGLRLVAAHADMWACLAVYPGAALGRYSLSVELVGDVPCAYDFPCVSLDECRAVLDGGHDEWENQWQRVQRREREWQQRRASAWDAAGHSDEDGEEADDPCITFCPSPAFAGGEPCNCAAFRSATST